MGPPSLKMVAAIIPVRRYTLATPGALVHVPGLHPLVLLGFLVKQPLPHRHVANGRGDFALEPTCGLAKAGRDINTPTIAVCALG